MPVFERMLVLHRCAAIHRRFNGHVLFAVYVLSVASVVLTNNTGTPETIFIWLVLPAFLAAMILPPQPASANAVHPIGRLFGSVILWASLIYIVVAIVSTVASKGLLPAEGRQIRLYVRWGTELAMFLAITAYLTATYPQFIKRFLLVVIVLLAVNAAINMIAFLRVPYTTLSAFRLSAVFGTPLYQNATHVAPLFAIYALAALGLAATQRLSRWENAIIAVCTPILLGAIILTQARGSLGVVAFALLVIAAAGSRRWRWWIAGLVLVGFDIVMVVPALRDAILERGASFRVGLVKDYLRLAAAHPWLGYGLDRTLNVEILGKSFEQPHNTLVWAQLRGGVIAAMAAAVMLCGSLFFSFRWWQKTKNIAPFVVVFALAATALTEIGFVVYPYNWLWITFWLPIGIGAGAELAVRDRALVSAPGAIRTFLSQRIMDIISSGDTGHIRPGVPSIAAARMSSMASTKPTVLITGASSGIGATYADRFARRGHDLVLVARDIARLEALAARLRAQTGVNVDVMQADLTNAAQLGNVEARLRYDASIGILVNNAGASTPGGFANPDLDAAENLIDLNVTSVVRLAGAIVPRLLKQGEGAIINISSALALVPEMPMGIYSATKAFVLAFSQNMAAELGPQGLYVQAVLPAATGTEIWARSGRDPNAIPNMMDVGDLVDAALVGFDRRESVTIPPLPDLGQWETYEIARRAMSPNFRQKYPADRYRS